MDRARRPLHRRARARARARRNRDVRSGIEPRACTEAMAEVFSVTPRFFCTLAPGRSEIRRGTSKIRCPHTTQHMRSHMRHDESDAEAHVGLLGWFPLRRTHAAQGTKPCNPENPAYWPPLRRSS